MAVENNLLSSYPLHSAVVMGNLDAVKNLISEGADVNWKDEDNIIHAPLFYAVRGKNEKHRSIVVLLIENGADINYRRGASLLIESREKDYSKGETLLEAAMENDNTDIAELLIEKGADVNAQSGFLKQTALHIAAFRGNQAGVELLFKCGADLTLKTSSYRKMIGEDFHDMPGRTPYDEAVVAKQNDVANWLKEEPKKILMKAISGDPKNPKLLQNMGTIVLEYLLP